MVRSPWLRCDRSASPHSRRCAQQNRLGIRTRTGTTCNALIRDPRHPRIPNSPQMLARTFASRLLQTAGPARRHFITATSTTLSPTLQRPAGAIQRFHPGLKKEEKMSASAPAEQSRRRFAPVGRRTGGGNDGGVQQLKGIVFDMDGTLCEYFSIILSLIVFWLGLPHPCYFVMISSWGP